MREGNITINVKDSEHIDKALKRFKRKFERLGISKKIRAKMYYKKPAMRRRDEHLKAVYRQKMMF